MKKLVAIGALLAAFAIAAWLLRSPPAGDAGTAKSPEIAPPRAAPAPSATRESAEPARAPRPQPAPTDEPPSNPAAAGRTDDAQQMAKCRAMWERERKVEQAIRAAEADDSAWADTMETKLHEYLSRRLRTSPIEVTGIDCKETFCEITGHGFVPEGDSEFRQALSDVRQESWNDFTGSSFSQNVEAGKVVYTAEVLRRQSYATARGQSETPEQVACTTLVSRQQQRKREALDAQPRDHGWADQMEQLLRMHIMTQLKQHPLEQVDIVCRTTVCRIKAKGQSNEALLAFQLAMNAVPSEPWANLRGGEAGSSGYGDSWTADYTMLRR